MHERIAVTTKIALRKAIIDAYRVFVRVRVGPVDGVIRVQRTVALDFIDSHVPDGQGHRYAVKVGSDLFIGD